MIPAQPQTPPPIASTPLIDLQRTPSLLQLLHFNRSIQKNLQTIRTTLIQRMKLLQEQVNRLRLKQNCPPNKIYSYVKFDRNVPGTLRHQLMIYQQKINQSQYRKQYRSEMSLPHIDSPLQLPLLLTKSQKKLPLSQRQEDLIILIKKLPPQPSFYDYISAVSDTSHQPIQLFYQWFQFHSFRSTYKQAFTNLQEIQIKQRKMKYGQCWQKISQIFNLSRSRDIFNHYQTNVRKPQSHGRWKLRQSLKLVILIQHLGQGNWKMIASNMPEKNQNQIKERWVNLVRPSLVKQQWNQNLQKRLLELAPEYGYSWKRLSALSVFKGMSDNAIWRQFKHIIIRFTLEQIQMYFNESDQGQKLKQIMLRNKKIHAARRRMAVSSAIKPVMVDFQVVSKIQDVQGAKIKKNKSSIKQESSLKKQQMIKEDAGVMEGQEVQEKVEIQEEEYSFSEDSEFYHSQ